MPEMPTTMRPYTGVEADLRAMGDLLLACRAAGPIDDYPPLTELRALLDPASSERQVEAALWEVGGRLVAFAYLEPRAVLFFYLHPDRLPADDERRREGIVAEILAWASARGRARGYEQIYSPAREDDAGRIALLRPAGFAPHHWVTVRMTRPLDAPLPEPRYPAGFTVRPVAGEEEVEAHVALHRAAFESTNPTAAHRLTVMRDPEYRPDLDLVAVAPDGTLAGFCLCSIGREENARLGRDEGWVDTLGTRPAYRKLGLGRALLLTGLWRLRASGVAVAVLGTGQGNPAIALYESVGFRVAYHVLWYRRPA